MNWNIFIFSTCLLCAVKGMHFTQQENERLTRLKREVTVDAESKTLEDSEMVARSRQKRSERKSYIFLDNRSGRRVQLYYRDTTKSQGQVYYTMLMPGQAESIDTYENHEWIAVDKTRRTRMVIGNAYTLKQKANSEATRAIYYVKNPGQRKTDIGDKYVEVLVVMDKSVADLHKTEQDAKRYVLVLLKMATHVYQHKSLTQHGVKIHLALSKLIILRTDKKEVQMNPAEGPGNLRKACAYMSKLGNNAGEAFDHKLFLTKQRFGMGGYANTHEMCSQRYSCSMVYDEGFVSAMLVAHEIGHAFGMDDKDHPQSSGYIMASVVDVNFNFYRWSTFSQTALLYSIRNHYCLDNKPKLRRKNYPVIYKYPGVHFSFLQQCQLAFDKRYSEYKHDLENRCRVLRCATENSKFGRSFNSPPLDGTECGPNKWCMSGVCQLRFIKSGEAVDGGWGDWDDWSKCSRNCDTGIQTQKRQCNNPIPRNGGKPCQGVSKQVRICKTGKTCSKSSISKHAMCSRSGRISDPRRRWTFQDESQFYYSQVNLDCTFEKDECSWKIEKLFGEEYFRFNKGQTLSSRTGPNFDHTTQSSKGQYIYLESSTSGKSKATLSSPKLNAKRACLVFWYHMRGDNQGSLRVRKISRGRSQVLWRRDGNKGNKWHQARINVEDSNEYVIKIIAKKKSGYRSDIALDDILFRRGPCQGSYQVRQKVDTNPCRIKCKTSDGRSPARSLSVPLDDGTTCSTKATKGACYQGMCKLIDCNNILTDSKNDRCVIVEDPQKSSLSCDFEKGPCQWKIGEASQDLKWLIKNGKRKGHYLYVESGNKDGRKVATIESPRIIAKEACLSFAFRLNRENIINTGLVIKVFERSENKDRLVGETNMVATMKRWRRANWTLKYNKPFKVVVEAYTHNYLREDIEIDDIRFRRERCQ